jgi:hypothetical protein
VTTDLLAAVPGLTDLLTGWRLVTSIAGILILASLAGRLLGTRRSLGAVVVSGLIGWLAGASLAVVVAHNHEHGQAGFVSQSVALLGVLHHVVDRVDGDARIASGARPRPAPAPRPLGAIRRKSQRVVRYAQISRIAARHGLARSLGRSYGGFDSRFGF